MVKTCNIQAGVYIKYKSRLVGKNREKRAEWRKGKRKEGFNIFLLIYFKFWEGRRVVVGVAARGKNHRLKRTNLLGL